VAIIDEQLEIFNASNGSKARVTEAKWGTFKDSLRAPIHRWFTYPAGFSYRAVEFSLMAHGIGRGKCVYDPFMGTGTTNVVAKSIGINSLGVEAHPFVFKVAKTKLDFELPIGKLIGFLEHVKQQVRRRNNDSRYNTQLVQKLPELVGNCYAPKTLRDLILIREAISSLKAPERYLDFLNVGLTSVLRQVASVHTGWPYIAPNKSKTTSESKDALRAFLEQIHLMASDLQTMRHRTSDLLTEHRVYEADARDTTRHFADNSADFVFTSPPYLNNFDYADRTRLEMYFFGHADNWGDISEQVRTKLMTSATTQISRRDPKYELSQEIHHACPDTYDFLRDAVQKLSILRLQKGGKKSYDLMVAGYFNDMFRVLKDTARILKPQSHALFILGDSAPYGVHIDPPPV
jgi:DNA modification methylase